MQPARRGYLLEIFYFVTAAGAVSQDRKNDHYYYGNEYHDDQDFHGRQQEAAEREDGTKQGDYQEN